MQIIIIQHNSSFSFKTKNATLNQSRHSQWFLVVFHGFEKLPAHSVHPGVLGGEEALYEPNVSSTRGYSQHRMRVALTLGEWESCMFVQ